MDSDFNCLVNEIISGFRKCKKDDQEVIADWLQRLGKASEDVRETLTKFEYLKYLNHVIKNGTLHYPFTEKPPCTALPPLEEYFLKCKPTTCENRPGTSCKSKIVEPGSNENACIAVDVADNDVLIIGACEGGQHQPPSTVPQSMPFPNVQPSTPCPRPNCPPAPTSVCPPPHTSVCPPAPTSICPPAHTSVCPPAHTSVCPPAHTSVCPPAHTSVCPPAHTSTCPPAHTSTCPPPHTSACPPAHTLTRQNVKCKTLPLVTAPSNRGLMSRSFPAKMSGLCPNQNLNAPPTSTGPTHRGLMSRTCPVPSNMVPESLGVMSRTYPYSGPTLPHNLRHCESLSDLANDYLNANKNSTCAEIERRLQQIFTCWLSSDPSLASSEADVGSLEGMVNELASNGSHSDPNAIVEAFHQIMSTSDESSLSDEGLSDLSGVGSSSEEEQDSDDSILHDMDSDLSGSTSEAIVSTPQSEQCVVSDGSTTPDNTDSYEYPAPECIDQIPQLSNNNQPQGSCPEEEPWGWLGPMS